MKFIVNGSREYDGIAMIQNCAQADSLYGVVLVWTDGEWETWGYDISIPVSRIESEIRRYYTDCFGWPESFTKVWFFEKKVV